MSNITDLPIDVTIQGKSVYYGLEYKADRDVVIVNSDISDFLEKLPEKSVNLVVTSPHYNMGKTHEKPLDLTVYLEWQESIITKCVKALQKGGSICWQSGNYVNRGETFPLDAYFYQIFKKLNLKLRNRIIWHFEHGLHSTKKFSGRYETILWFTKDDNYTFNLDKVRVPQKYPGKRGYKGPNKGKPTCNRLGKNPTDYWTAIKGDWETGLWDIPNVKANHPEKTLHPSQFPIELVERLILALTNENDVVFDPFMGSGSSVIASIINGRKGIGVDIQKQYTDIAFERIKLAYEGNLKRRVLGTPIYQPNGKEKVSLAPVEWKQ